MTKLRSYPRTSAAFRNVAEDQLVFLHSLGAANNYSSWLAEALVPHRVGRLAEIGAGTGNITARLRERSNEVVAVEPSILAFEQLAQRFSPAADVECIHGDHLALSHEVDCVVMSNVLEHIEDDVDALRALKPMIRPGGTAAVLCPAFEALYSDFDYRIGHFRRYRRSELVDRFREAGYRVEDSRYVNAIGAPAWWWYVRVLNREPGSNRRFLDWWDRFVIPPSRWVESRQRPPFGQSVLVIGTPLSR